MHNWGIVMRDIQPINEEIRFEEHEIIVSKTDLKGRIEYVNDVFCRVSEMTTSEVVGQQHSIIRHPDMPRTVFKLLWDTLQGGNEIFAYVKNMSASGRFYWVIAHVTPSRNVRGDIVGYHSTRRVPSRKGISEVEPFYRKLLQVEQSQENRKQGLAEGEAILAAKLASRGTSYEEFIWSTGE